MNLQPVRFGSLYSASGTATAADYRPVTYLKPAPAGALESKANQRARVLTLGSSLRLARLRTYAEDWDGNGSAAPRAASIANAEARLQELYRSATVKGVWREPHVSASEAGEVTFEWWSDDLKLTMYFGDEGMEIVRVWGLDIDTEMDHQTLPSPDGFATVWAWLYGN